MPSGYGYDQGLIQGLIMSPQRPIWVWHPFGRDLFIVHINHEVSWIRRIFTRALLGSIWERYDEFKYGQMR